MRAEMQTGFEKVDAEFVAVRNEIKAESAALRHEMAIGFAKVDARFEKVEAEFVAVRSEIKSESSALRDEFSKFRWDLIKWIFILFFGQTAFLTGILKWFH